MTPAGFAADQRGDGPIGLMVAASVFLAGSMLVVQLALGHHAGRVVEGAAQAGATHGARFGATPADGVAVTDGLIQAGAGSLLVGWSTSASVEDDGPGRRLVITVDADVAGPFGRWPVTAVGGAPVEEFVPQAANR